MAWALLENSANPNGADKRGRIPFHFAFDSPFPAKNEVLKVLLDNGADVEATAHNGDRGIFILIRSADRKRCENGNKYHLWRAYSPLYRAISRQLESYEDSSERDPALPMSRAKGTYGCLVNLLLDKGADIEEKSKFGPTPLFYALRVGNEAAVSLLLARGAETKVKGMDCREILLIRAAPKRFFSYPAYSYILAKYCSDPGSTKGSRRL
ncbi:hypothetical protein TWF970_007184 [Orbilia oligospora]|uniref:Uncharacterized protein n=1 Tax=Orbilia oligospora TaxID=2813651 RepID=A0A7C8RF50_ORBOL|nr:hypothetical protein TWF970_007184 [Orbilia oligospora]